ncbi:MAG: hypothetical protein AABZ00_00395 [Chloroflexota bacterium]
MDALIDTHLREIISAQEFQEAWIWLLDHISIDQSLVEEHGYYFDHKHWKYPDYIKCIDECDDADIYLARLYLVSQLASVSDYLPNLKKHIFNFELRYSNNQLDGDVARVINAEETAIHLNAFRNSLSEHLAFWAMLASIIKVANHQDFSISKPNLQPEDKGPDGLACIVGNDFSIIKIISVKNSIISPQDLISSASFRGSSKIVLNEKKIFDEFYAFLNRNRGFQRLDDKLNTLLQELHQDEENLIRHVLLSKHSQFNAMVVADEQYAANNLFTGFNKVADEPLRCIGIYVGSGNWKDLADSVQTKVKEILTTKRIAF